MTCLQMKEQEALTVQFVAVVKVSTCHRRHRHWHDAKEHHDDQMLRSGSKGNYATAVECTAVGSWLGALAAAGSATRTTDACASTSVCVSVLGMIWLRL